MNTLSTTHCAIENCRTTILNKPPGVSFHPCPTNNEMRKRWLRLLKNKCSILDWYKSQICSKHFEPKYFDAQKKLKENAVPTIFAPILPKLTPKPSPPKASVNKSSPTKPQTKVNKQNTPKWTGFVPRGPWNFVTKPQIDAGVYKLDCDCGLSYIGQTKRSIGTRVKEHIADVKHRRSQKSAVCEHTIDKAQHYIRFDKPQVLAKENRFLPRMIREAIEIKKHPNFNREDGWVLPPAWHPIIDSIKPKSKPKTARPKDTTLDHSKSKVDILLNKLTQAELTHDIKTSLSKLKEPSDLDMYVSDDLKCQQYAPKEAVLWLMIKKQENLNNRLMDLVVQTKKHVEILQNHSEEAKNSKRDNEQTIESLKYVVKCLQEKHATLEEQIEILTSVESR